MSIPDLFSLSELDYIHWDGNTNSVMQRNIAQAVALGDYYDAETSECHVLPHEIHKLDFNQMLGDHPFPKVLGEIAGKLESAVFRANNIVGVEAEAMSGKKAEWRETTGYYPRALRGVWATAPNLHNGSVPTLHDLLSRRRSGPPPSRSGIAGLTRSRSPPAALSPPRSSGRPSRAR